MATGDHDDFRDFREHYQPFVRAYVERRVSEPEVADLVAAVFAEAAANPGRWASDALPWLYQTARGLIQDRFSAKEQLLALREAFHPTQSQDEANVRIPAERQRLFEALAALRDDDREMLLLATWEGLDAAGVASVMNGGALSGALSGTLSGTVKLHRARRRFEHALGGSDTNYIGMDISRE